MAEKKDKTKNLMPPWPKGVSGNPKGTPRKPLSVIIKQYIDAGVEKPTKAEILDVMAISFNLTEDDLVDIAKNKNASMAARHLARMLLTNGKEGARNFMQLFETLHGKPQINSGQTIDEKQQFELIIKHVDKSKTTAPDDYK